MTEGAKKVAPPRKGRNLEDEIARQEAKLRKLQDNLKEKKRREYERNARAISALLQAEHLDQVLVETWQQHLPALKALLVETSVVGTTADANKKPAPAASAPPAPAGPPQAGGSNPPAAAAKPASNSDRT